MEDSQNIKANNLIYVAAWLSFLGSVGVAILLFLVLAITMNPSTFNGEGAMGIAFGLPIAFIMASVSGVLAWQLNKKNKIARVITIIVDMFFIFSVFQKFGFQSFALFSELPWNISLVLVAFWQVVVMFFGRLFILYLLLFNKSVRSQFKRGNINNENYSNNLPQN